MTQPKSLPSIKAPFDSLTLRAVVSELRARLIGGQVQDIRQPSPSELRLGIRSQGRNYNLALSCDARFARVHLTEQRQPNAPVPPSFCMSLRKHCEGAVIRDVRQRDFDRVLELQIGARTGELDSTTTTLIAELMGKHSNLILVSAAGVILEAAKRISRKVNRFREVLPGLSYAPPPEQGDRLDPFDLRTVETLQRQLASHPASDLEVWREWLIEHVGGMSPFLAQHVASQLFHDGHEDPERVAGAWDAVFGAAARDAFRPVSIVSGGRTIAAYPFPVAQVPLDSQRPTEDLNAALDAVYSGAVERAGTAAVLGELRGQIERDSKRLARQKDLAERTLREADRAEQHKQTGELILANLWRIEPDAASITVQDYFDPALADRTLTLDPRLSPQENADALFRRYRKVRDGQATAELRRAEADALLARLYAAKSLLAEWEAEERVNVADIQKIREDLRAQGLLQQRGGDKEEDAKPGPDLQGHKIRRVTTPEGYEIYIGETATANDYLTTRLAASNDLWLHVRSSTSAHVVIKTQGKPEAVPRSVIEYAALLCARHSSQKHSGLVPVDYTLKKHVRKPRGAAPGSADYHHETTLHITP
jgi:predicted ribosome quality control (RQC) complex YloA/Tae2 family protein